MTPPPAPDSCRTPRVRLMRTCDSGIAGVPETMTMEMRQKNTSISQDCRSGYFIMSNNSISERTKLLAKLCEMRYTAL